jgi:hypothetical protein
MLLILTVDIQGPRVFLRTATNLFVLRTARQGLPRIVNLRRERECASGHISIRAYLKQRRKYPSKMKTRLYRLHKMFYRRVA